MSLPIWTLRIIAGSTESIDVEFVNNSGASESAVGADRATFCIWKSLSDAAPYFEWRTDLANLSILAGSALVLRATLTLSESEALAPGQYVGGAGVRFGSEDSWKLTDRFPVIINPRTSTRVAP